LDFFQRTGTRLESLFSAVQRKFSDHVRGTTPDLLVNESLAKLLYINLCSVILSQCELGIEAEFWEIERPTKAAWKRCRWCGRDKKRTAVHGTAAQGV
jgi:hypothetical protein